MASKIKMKIAYCPICNREHAMELLGRGFLVQVNGNMVFMDEEFYRCPEKQELYTTEPHLAEMIEESRKNRDNLPYENSIDYSLLHPKK